jgi:hypothetical protein
MTIFPKLTTIALSEALPGTIVIHEKKIGFVVLDDDQEGDGNYLACYDRQKQEFAIEYSQPRALVLTIDAGAGVVIDLDVINGTALGTSRGVANSHLLVQADRAYFVLPRNPGFHSYVEIATGRAKKGLSGHVASCINWKVGIRNDLERKVNWLIQVDGAKAT